MDVWPKNLNVRAKKSSLCLLSAHDLFASVFIWPSALLLKQEEVLPSGGSSHVSSLACQRTQPVTMSFYQVYFICSEFNCLKDSCRGMDFEKLNRAPALFGIDSFDLGPNTKMGRIFKPRRKRNEK